MLPDGRVLHTARNGAIRLTTPDTGVTKVINTVDVYNNSEDGMQTVTLDPNFAENNWVYLYYAPRVMTAPYPTTTPTGSRRTPGRPVPTTPTGTSGRVTTSSPG